MTHIRLCLTNISLFTDLLATTSPIGMVS